MIKNPFKRKNKDEQQDLSIIQEYHEPVTISSLWKRWVIQPSKAIHDYLQKNGVLTFLLSPFQYKNRLILKILVIVVGIVLGGIPRGMDLIHNIRERNLSSELATTSTETAGNITVSPLSSGYDNSTRTHLLAFNITGDSNDGVPSTNSGYSVSVTPHSIANVSGMKYRYKIIPVSQTSRLILIAVTGQPTTGGAGVYTIKVRAKNSDNMDTPLSVVLSSKQKSSELYSDGKIQLAALSNALTSSQISSPHAIRNAQNAIKKDVSNYQVNEQRLNASNMTLGITTSKLKQIVASEISMAGLNDNSTTADLTNINTNQPTQPSITSTITLNGKTYKSNSANADSSDVDSDDSDSNGSQATNKQGVAISNAASQVKNTELPNLDQLIQNIQNDIATLNQARVDKYNALVGVQNVLNQTINLSSFTTPVAITK